MKITLKETPENFELIADMASNETAKRVAAQEAFAEFIRDPILTVIQQGSVWGSVFRDFKYDKYDGPHTIPLDDFFDVKEVDYFRVWSSTTAGGLPTQQGHGIGEMPFSRYELDSAVSFKTRQLRRQRIDHVSRQLTRAAQEVLVKQERNRSLLMLTALAKASTDVYAGPGGGNPTSFKHVIRSYFANQFNLQDYNRLRTRHKRIFSSWAGGTPAQEQDAGITDIYCSPEIVEFFRNLAFEPMNLRAGPSGTAGTPNGTTVGIPGMERVRDEIYNNGGVPSFFGVNLFETNELGIGWKLNAVFATAAGSTSFGNYGDGTSATTFDSANEELCVAVNARMDGLLRPIATDSDVGSQLTTYPDDSLFRRSEEIGFYMKLEEGNLVLDPRQVSGIIV